MMLIFITAPLAGCGTVTINTYCDTTKALYFDTDATPEWLLANDRGLLTDIIVHNETRERICK
jgi:hypothetical protein